MLHNMVVLGQDMKQKVSLCPMRHNKAVLVWEASKPDYTTEEVLVAYTIEEDKKGESQYVVELVDDAWETSNQ